MRTRLAWYLSGLSALCLIIDTLVVAAFQPLLSEASIAVHGWPLVPGAALGSALMGALIISRYPRHPVGWLLSIVGVSTSISIVAESYSIWVTDEGGPGPERAGHLASWVAAILGGPFGITGVTLVFLLVPDGQLLTRRWRLVVAMSITALALFMVGLLGVPMNAIAGRGEPDEVGTFAQIFLTSGALLTAVSLVSSVVSMLLRLRRSEGEARQQLRWIAFSAGAVGVGLVNLLSYEAVTGEQTWASALPLFIAYLFLPVCIALAVLRHRLYEIDLIINRAVMLTAGTLLVAVGYVALVVGVGGMVGGRADGFWPALLATGLVAIAFQPLRRGVVRFADRLAYGRQAAPYDALSAFSRRIGHIPAPGALLPAVAEAAGLAVSAGFVRVRLAAAKGATEVATWPPDGRDTPGRVDIDIPVTDRGGDLGSIAVSMPAGRALRPGDLRLLDDIAGQAGLAFRNARLEAELIVHVEALDQRAEQLAASRRRLIEAGDAERRRLEAVISREVMPALANLRSGLNGTGDNAAPAPSALIQHAAEALESLRDLTRGIFPTTLTRLGLAPALESQLSRLGLVGVLEIDESAAGRRFPPRTEAAAFFCCTESVRDGGRAVRVRLEMHRTDLTITVHGGALRRIDHLAVLDRVEAAGGSLELTGESAGSGARLCVTLPASSDATARELVRSR